MDNSAQIAVLKGKVEALISEDPTLFLVEIRIKPTHNIKIFIDGDQGVSIDKLVQYNRRLYKEIEGTGLFPGDDFSLELSSPGLDEPLKLHRQYLKNIGRNVEVMEQDGSIRSGKLLVADEKGITVEEEKGKNKKKEIVAHMIPFENIKTTKIQIKF